MPSENPGLPFGTPTTSEIYVDGSPMQPPDFYKISATSLNYHEGGKTDKSFWSSVPRRQADTTVEVYEVALSSRQLVNTIAFSLARFPHRVRAQYQDADGNWQNMRHSFGTPVQYAINDSLPSIISPNALAQGASHPQHYGAGHWIRQKAVLRPFKTRRVRLLLERSVGSPPLDTNRNALAYSLGVREFSVGYKVEAKSTIPKTRRHPTVLTEYDPFATGLDSLGSPLAYAARENRAGDLLRGKTWRCEPQPVPDAVVSLYVDARDDDGSAPVVDRFYMDPLTLGVQLNLYYSNDDSEDQTFRASDDLMGFPNSTPLGVLTPTADGLLFEESNASITFENKAIQWNPSKGWWIGGKISPKFSDTDTQTRVLIDSSMLSVTLTEGVLGVGFGSASVAQSMSFEIGETIPFVISFTTDGTLSLHTNYGYANTNAPGLAVEAGETPVPQIRMGANLLDLVGSSFVLLQEFVLKQEDVADPIVLFEDFVANPDDFIVKAEFESEDTGGTDNAILRYHPSFQTPGVESVNPLGWLGGAGDLFAEKEWTPVARDFRLARGMLHFPPTKAKYFKFEFTELQAAPYDTYAPVVKRVKKHPDWIKEVQKGSKKGGPRKDKAKGGLGTSVDVARVNGNFPDSKRFIGSEPRRGNTAAASMVASDQSLARQMRQISSYFNLVKWLPGTINTKWQKGKHRYQTVDIDHVHRVAYFVGINSMEMFRLDYTVDDDSEQYVEVFHDDDNLLVNEWNVGDNRAATSIANTAMESKVMNSRRKIRGVQFATVQSKPLQLLADADFLDTTLANWAPFGDVSELVFSQELESDLGTTIRVSRNMGLTGRSWDDAESLYPNWDATDGLLWDDIESDLNAINYGGIVGTQTVTTTPRGRVYAAARVFVAEPLSEPLYLQIVTPDNNVVAETVFDPQPGQINEWFTGYTIGEGGETTGLTWDDMEATYADWDTIETYGSWNQVSEVTESLLSVLLPRLVQHGLTDDEWDVDNISIFNDPIVWEFSNDGGTTFYPAYDIRNNPEGVLIFPDADVLDPSVGFSTKFAWRATSYYPGSWVTSLVIRPWYTGLSLGIPHREAVQYGGPNHSPWDDYPEIHEDPHWMAWDLPVPQDWWFRFRRAILPTLVPRTPDPITVLPESIVMSPETEPGQFVLNDPFVI